MDLNTVKKELYKQNPIAELTFENSEFKAYSCELTVNGESYEISFEIPLEDCAESLASEIEAKYLIRWIV